MTSLFNSFDTFNSFDYSKVLKLNDYSPSVQQHLANVYLALVACLVSAAVGVWVSMVTSMGNIFGLLGSMGMILWIQMDQNKHDLTRRLAMLCGFGVFQGISVGPLISLAIDVDPAIIMTAVLGTVTVFACFSASAIMAKRRSYLFLGGILSSAISLMFLLSFANIFFQSSNLYALQLYGGLMVFSGYVVFDTQLILEKAELGSRDVIGHALELFLDFMAILIRIIVILMKSSKKKKGRNSNDRR